jgi:hypothetical protein
MNTETKHSELPWEVEAPSLVVLDAYGNVVADCEVETFRVALGGFYPSALAVTGVPNGCALLGNG